MFGNTEWKSQSEAALTGKAVLITGGTGSFGKKFVATILEKYGGVRRLVVYSRDELKQSEMQQTWPTSRYPQLRFFIGDVRDKERLFRAMEDVDIVVHTAALKQVPAAEYNPFEVIKTNVIGAQNVIETAMDRNVGKVVALSTDKAAAPINLYGATKLCADKLFVSANHFRGKRDIKFSVVRYGNVMGSRGSVIPFFLDKRPIGVLPITDPRMTRFNITLDEGVTMVLYALTHMWGGEIFVPKIPSYRISELADAIAPECKRVTTGIRPGEKLHEEMITATDALQTLEFSHHFVILPTMPLWDKEKYAAAFKGSACPEGFSYSSGTNTRWLTIPEIQELIHRHVDPAFMPEGISTALSGRRTITLIRGSEDKPESTPQWLLEGDRWSRPRTTNMPNAAEPVGVKEGK